MFPSRPSFTLLSDGDDGPVGTMEQKTYQIFAEIKIKIWNWYQYKSRQNGRTRHGEAARPFPPHKTLSISSSAAFADMHTPPSSHFLRFHQFYSTPRPSRHSFYVRRRITTRGGGLTDRQDPSLFGWVFIFIKLGV